MQLLPPRVYVFPVILVTFTSIVGYYTSIACPFVLLEWRNPSNGKMSCRGCSQKIANTNNSFMKNINTNKTTAASSTPTVSSINK